ncbi:MAG: NAD(P)/FAD-dependent oxidoreductase [Actinomycetota bacterium]
MTNPDAIVIGAGHNGLVAAAYLAKAGKKVVVLERRDVAGGILANSELEPGVEVPSLMHTVGRLRSSVVKDLKLVRHGLELIEPAVRAFAPQLDGDGITFYADAARTAAGLRAISEADANGYEMFDQKVRALASFLAHVNAATPPDIKQPSVGDAIAGLKLGRAFRGLGAKAGREVTRAIPMAIADFAREGLDHDAVVGAVASRGILFTGMGVWSAGTAFVFLNDSAGNDGGAIGQTTYARGGPAALAQALVRAAQAHGAEVRTGAEVTQILTDDSGRAVGVRLTGGETLRASAIVTAADPKRTLTRLVDPVVLGPYMRWRAGNIRTPGVTAKVNLALSGLPTFTGADSTDQLQGRIVIAPGIDYLERSYDASKYGRVAEEPFMEVTIPSLLDESLAPEGRHVMSVLAQAAPHTLREAGWDSERDRLGEVVVKTLERYAPGLGELVTAREVITPADMERDFGLSGGHLYHAEHGMDSFFAWRPMLGHARYRFGIDGLYLAGAGAHPGGGITGAPGANAARVILSDLRRRG